MAFPGEAITHGPCARNEKETSAVGKVRYRRGTGRARVRRRDSISTLVLQRDGEFILLHGTMNMEVPRPLD